MEERVRLLREEILKEAEIERRKLWDEFERKKSEDWEKSRFKAEREALKMLEETQMKAEELISREVADAIFTGRKIVLEERDLILQETLQRAKERIFSIVESKEDYRERLIKLTKECIEYLGNSFSVLVNPRDIELIRDIAKELNIDIKIQGDTKIIGGIKAWSGKRAIDNTLEGRWERKKREIQMEVLKELFE
ncbi:MAG: V-type ATP synthase subunit E family protein [Synergistetes bacterium]|nr:V-type ATP synthase subunit E family protein [Synergistota bacterium]MDW8191738.1 V-type ATP synthase subunit E family protein [Synergistota bacterium]